MDIRTLILCAYLATTTSHAANEEPMCSRVLRDGHSAKLGSVWAELSGINIEGQELPQYQALLSMLSSPVFHDRGALQRALLEINALRNKVRNLPQAERWASLKALKFLEEQFISSLSELPPEDVRSVAATFWPNEITLDRLLKLNGPRLATADLEYVVPNGFADETYAGWHHDYYSSCYSSFEHYDRALKIPDGGTVVDLGAGPFRAAVYYALRRPSVSLIGYELLPARVAAGELVIRQLGSSAYHSIFQVDLTSDDLAIADANGYLMMHPFSEQTAENLFSLLKQKALTQKKGFRILVFEAASAAIRIAKNQNWLRELEHWAPRPHLKYGFFVFETLVIGTQED